MASSSSHSAMLQCPKRLQGKVAIITGGASGIGKASSELFVSQGAKVVIADIQDELGHQLADSLGGKEHAHYVHCDVTSETEIASAVDFCISTYGQLDIMFNNAGICGPLVASITEVEAHDFDNLLAVNLRGTLLGTKHAARVMIPAQRGGSIICVASTAGVIAGGTTHAYAISKSAVIGAVRTVASELSEHGIRMNCISPYAIATPLVVDVYRRFMPSVSIETVATSIEKVSGFYGARLEAKDIANAASFLASDEARYISGHNLVVDGSYTVAKPFNPIKDMLGELSREFASP